ncbi:KGK domain-containing protein [Oscillatoria sp. FACHB-1406]|uniref:KGK domain-containing protein n=1 Tax=Oscillatoria sp. FACHB-1406 TaxID=2692846 RepID=UPI0016893591|nr:KGK domain-containing protein [Oscillatoria sp. FACHB-1406]MBD2580223.1 hypothetical protein [Oscillatoria sp. FACHB-1406]
MWNSIDIPGFKDEDIIAFKDSLVKLGKFINILDTATNQFNELLKTSFADNKLNLDIRFNESCTYEHRFMSERGVDVEILKLKDPRWQKGKIRMKLVVEFIPDEPEKVESESPLDDIRQAQLAKQED